MVEVSILVLMDSGFRRFEKFSSKKARKSFNPCFNGLGFQTLWDFMLPTDLRVSILVLMDSGFRQILFHKKGK